MIVVGKLVAVGRAYLVVHMFEDMKRKSNHSEDHHTAFAVEMAESQPKFYC